jgi:hypothetical protein
MMAGFFVMLYGMVAFFAIIMLLDWLGRRKDRQSHNQSK